MFHTIRDRVLLIILTLLMAVFALLLASCTLNQTGPTYLDAGPNDLNVTPSQFSQYSFFRFDTAAAGHTLTFPSAADLIAEYSGSSDGTFVVFIVASDGNNPVNLAGGPNVTVKPSAASISGNRTQTLFCVFTGTASGSQAISIY